MTKTKRNFDCYRYKYSLIALKCMWLPTNHIAQPITLSLLLGLPWVPSEVRLSILLFLYSNSTFILVDNWYLFILKDYRKASKTSRLYSFWPKDVLLLYLSVNMHFNQSQCSVILFAGYYIKACCTLMASITMHFDWLI